MRKERQLEGIAAAKAAGVYKGRPATIDAAKIAALKAEGLGPRKLRSVSALVAHRFTALWTRPSYLAKADTRCAIRAAGLSEAELTALIEERQKRQRPFSIGFRALGCE